MNSPYPDFSANESPTGQSFAFKHSVPVDPAHRLTHNPLMDVASSLLNVRRYPSRLSPLVLMTDPSVIPDPVEAAQKLPQGAAIIYRHFGAVDKLRVAQNLRQVTKENKQQFLIGNDPELALDVKADGVHFRRDDALIAPSVWRKHYPKWIITMAGLKDDYLAYTAPVDFLDGLFVSSVFKSESSTATKPLDVVAFKSICDTLKAPVFALGGVNTATAPKLIGSGAAGIAGIRGIFSGMSAE